MKNSWSLKIPQKLQRPPGLTCNPTPGGTFKKLPVNKNQKIKQSGGNYNENEQRIALYLSLYAAAIPTRPKDVGFLEFYTRWLLGPQGDVTLFLGPSSCLHVSHGSPRCILEYYIRDE